MGVHGYVRATDELGFVSRQALVEAREKLRKAGIETRLLRGDALDGGFSCLQGEIDGIPFDVQPPLVPIAWDQALTLEIGGGTLRVVDLDGLLQLKFRAGGPQDLLDAARLVLRHPGSETRAKELATAYRSLGRFEACLGDPRTLVQAREDAEREARRAKKPARETRSGSAVRSRSRKSTTLRSDGSSTAASERRRPIAATGAPGASGG